jgi:hypothetical protein
MVEYNIYGVGNGISCHQELNDLFAGYPVMRGQQYGIIAAYQESA